ncbi:MAG TPA: hypothetical protein EYP62_00955, partial [Kiritimatiellae bacterium]|nr:hypothetical protein [Kiritimatiellia bacterium]
FPGSGTDYPVAPGEFVVIAADADSSDGFAPDLGVLADWECYAGSGDFDNPTVPNLILVSGQRDFSLYPGGDNVILADGSDTNAPIDAGTIIDAVNFAGGGGELASLSPGAGDHDPSVSAPVGKSINRCPDGWDTDYSSSDDFFPRDLTPGLTNDCEIQSVLSVEDATVTEGDSASTSAVFRLYLSESATATVSVEYSTSPGTASAGIDYSPAAGTVSFLPGVTEQTVSVAVYGDTNREDHESFYLHLSNAVNAVLGDNLAVGTIRDDDGFLIVSISACETQAWITWESWSGRTYRLEYSPQLSNPVWNALGDTVTATGATASAQDSTISNVQQRFYRISKLD